MYQNATSFIHSPVQYPAQAVGGWVSPHPPTTACPGYQSSSTYTQKYAAVKLGQQSDEIAT